MEVQTSKGAHKMLQEGCVCTQGASREVSVHTGFSKRVQQQKPAFKAVNYSKVTV